MRHDYEKEFVYEDERETQENLDRAAERSRLLNYWAWTLLMFPALLAFGCSGIGCILVPLTAARSGDPSAQDRIMLAVWACLAVMYLSLCVMARCLREKADFHTYRAEQHRKHRSRR